MRCSQPTRRTPRLPVAVTLALGCMASPVLIAQPGDAPGARPAAMATMAVVRHMEDSLVALALRAWGANVMAHPPGWPEAVNAAEHLVGRTWRGLPAILLLVPDDGRGFFCGTRRCLGHYLGTSIALTYGDSTAVVVSSIVLVAQSAISRTEVWEHELTHAILTQQGLLKASTRHDPRYFRDKRTIIDAHR